MRLGYRERMSAHAFDATITIGDHHLAATGLEGRRADAVAAVRAAVEQMDGAHWIDVEAQNYPPQCSGWLIVYPQGQCITPDSSAWRDLRHRVEQIATAVMIALGTPF